MKKKFKFAVAICGPTMMYSNIFKAETPEEATRMYLDSLGNEYTETDVIEAMKRIREVAEIDRSGMAFKDALGIEITIDDSVIIAQKYEQYKLKIATGTITRFTSACVFVKVEDGTECKFLTDETCTAHRIVKIKNPIQKASSNVAMVDALGQEIVKGDHIVFLGSFRTGTYTDFFIDGGYIDHIREPYVKGDLMSGKKQAKSIVVIEKG